jgi:putative ABC transport system permease protein
VASAFERPPILEHGAMRLFGELARQAPLVVRQLRRNPRRTALTFFGLVIAFFLYTSLESLLYTMSHVVSGASRDALLFVRPIDPDYWRATLPASYADAIEDLPGVVAASPVRFHFGSGREEGSFVVAMGVEPDAYLKMGIPDGVTGSELRAFLTEREAALVGARLLADNGWKLGERVTIRGRARMPDVSFAIRGDIARDDRLGRVAMVRLDYLEELLGGAGRASYVQVRAADAGVAAAVADAIDQRFANYTMPTETVTEKAHIAPFIASLSDARDGLRIVGYLALAVTLLVVANSVAVGVRERTREIGTLRAVGYGRGRVVGLVIGEALLVAVAGGTLGALAAYWLFSTGVVTIPGAGFGFRSDASVVVRAALLSLPLGLLAGAQPAWSAVRMTISDALRYTE